MPRVSKAILTDKDLAELSDQLHSLLAKLTSTQDVKDFMEEFLTKEEKIMLGKRLALYHGLYTQHDPSYLQQLLGVSNEMVRIYNQKRFLKSEKFKNKILHHFSKGKAMRTLQNLEKKLKPLELMLRSRNDMKARAKIMHGNFE